MAVLVTLTICLHNTNNYISDKQKVLKFKDLASNKKHYDVSRLFAASLQLVRIILFHICICLSFTKLNTHMHNYVSCISCLELGEMFYRICTMFFCYTHFTYSVVSMALLYGGCSYNSSAILLGKGFSHWYGY